MNQMHFKDVLKTELKKHFERFLYTLVETMFHRIRGQNFPYDIF